MLRTAVITIVAISSYGQAEIFKNITLGVSEFRTKVEHRVGTECSRYNTNYKKFENCRKRVTKDILKSAKKRKK